MASDKDAKTFENILGRVLRRDHSMRGIDEGSDQVRQLAVAVRLEMELGGLNDVSNRLQNATVNRHLAEMATRNAVIVAIDRAVEAVSKLRPEV